MINIYDREFDDISRLHDCYKNLKPKKRKTDNRKISGFKIINNEAIPIYKIIK